MSRLAHIARNPKRTLGALATVAVAASLTAGSGAYFADESGSRGNSVTAGTVAITTFGSADPVIDANKCRNLDDAFIDAADAQDECKNPAIQSTGSRGATFTVSNLVPSTDAEKNNITRCFAVTNDSDVPVAIKIDVDRVGGNQALRDALMLRLTRVPGGTVATPGFSGGDAYSNVWADIATSTLANVDAAAAQTGDNLGNGDQRRALEPTETYTYCADVWLPESNADQSDLEGKTATFRFNALAKSINSSES